MYKEKVVVIIPTFNEALVIEETITQVFEATASMTNMTIHILIFDSNSTDHTRAIVTRLMTQYAHLHLQSEPSKTGLGSAYLQAMRYALNELSADYVMEFDADLSHQPQYIPSMLEQLKTHDVVIGSRYVSTGSIPKNWGWHRKLLSVFGNLIARCVLTFQYKDFTSGFRVTHQAALRKALPEKFISNHYAYKIQLLWSLHKNKAKIMEYPIVFIDREKGQSKLPSNSILDSLKVLFLLRFYDMKSYVNMCLVGLSGMLVQLVVYNVLRQQLSLTTALQCAVVCSILNNFTLNYLVTFKKRAPLQWAHKLRLFSLFIGFSLLMISAQSYWLELGIQYLGAGSLNENMILISGIILGSFINYFTYTKAIWQKNNKLTA